MSRDPHPRLQKALAQLGIGSRREVESWIRAGRLTVNGAAAELGVRVRHSDQIRLDGRLVRRRPGAAQQVFVCHRSPGEPLERGAARAPGSASAASALEPRSGTPVRLPLFERLPRVGGPRFIAVSPMPRHDGGLELVTSDGELATTLQRAARELIGEFSVRIRGELTEAQLAAVQEGRLDGGARLDVTGCAPRGGEGSNRWYTVTVRGARGKDVRRLFERCGAFVSRVLRTRLGPVTLERSLARGQFRRLAQAELTELLGVEAAPGDSAAGGTQQRKIRSREGLR
ncbi:MAG TPA: S4 domain-containing protein [Steroidobacteraceae bacterium]|nr:S4 domain-containing protein [Steroidobacteraceae bacterium]